VNAFYGESYRAIRELERELGIDLMIAAICSTGVSSERAQELSDRADISWACASSHVRKLGCLAILQLTYGIPVFIYSWKGLELIAAYSDEQGAKRLRNLDPDEQYVLATDVAGERIAVGKGYLYLAPATLPVIKGKQPDPLS
jgi:hypothetical protein